MKALTAHQSLYLPWLGLFHKSAVADVFVYMDDVKYSKSYVMNRNMIKHPEGRPHRLTVPLVGGKDDNKLIHELRIDNSQAWAVKHARVLKEFYRSAPYFSEYREILDFYDRPYTHLADLNFDMLAWFLDQLGIHVPVRRASPYRLTSRSNDYLIDLCRANGCDVYIFGASGLNYVDLEKWERAGITPVFQDYVHPEYPQIHGTFVSNLSTIDLLFNCGPMSLDLLLSGNPDLGGLLDQARATVPGR